MCKRSLIGPIMLVIGLLYILISSLLVLVSVNLAGNDEATVAFNGANIAAAVWLLLIAALMCPLSITGAYGARKHNKFCLCSFCSLTLVLLFTMWGVAGTLERLSFIPIPEADALVCLTSGHVGGPNGTATNLTATTLPNGEEEDPCTALFSDEYIDRLRKLWIILHDRAQDQSQADSKKWNTFMVKLQKGEIAGFPCCGFLRPAHCTGLSGETCNDAVQEDSQHVYYTKTQICNQGNGGCKFDKPMGICAYEDLQPETSGCAYTMMTWIQSQMNSTASLINVFSMIPLLGWIYSLCMVFKRKSEDVLPAIYTAPKIPPPLSAAIITKV